MEQGGEYGKEMEGMTGGRDRRCDKWKRGDIWRMLADCGRNRLIILLFVDTMIVL